MTDTRIYISSIYDICRSVQKDEFNPYADEDTIYSVSEAYPEHPFSQLILDADDEYLGHQILYGVSGNPVLVRHAGRQKTSIAHFSNALLVHDSLSIIASGNRLPFPNNYNEYSLHNVIEHHTNLSTVMYSVRKDGPRKAIEWEHYLKEDYLKAHHVFMSTPHVLLANINALSYFHFMMDTIPRLWIYDVWPQLRALPIIIFPMNDEFEQVLAKAIGVPRAQLIVIPHNVNARFSFQHLILPSGLCDRMVTEKQVAFIRSKTAGGSFKPSDRPWRRIFMSRNDRPYRTIANEAELEAALKPYGFETVLGAGLSIAQQAKLFGEAEMLVGVLGGGWTNMLFMAPGTVLLELTQRQPDLTSQGHQVLMELASVCRLHHLMLTSDWDFHVLPRGELNPNPYCPTAMTYDVKRVTAAVEAGLAMLASRT